jgi:hypothetical protein
VIQQALIISTTIDKPFIANPSLSNLTVQRNLLTFVKRDSFTMCHETIYYFECGHAAGTKIFKCQEAQQSGVDCERPKKKFLTDTQPGNCAACARLLRRRR